MKYKIVHDMPGRLRVRCGEFAFSLEQSYSIEYVLKKSDYIEDVDACHVTGSILIFYNENFKEKVFEIISNINVSELPELDDDNKENSKEIDREFQNTLLHMFGKRLFIKLFMPTPIRKTLAIWNSFKFMNKGVTSLLQGEINVDVLDAASIGAALSQKAYKTAGSIMFLLNISELLEDYTRKKTKNELTKSLAINVESVWLANDDKEILIPIGNLQVGDKIVIHTGNVIPVDGVVCDGEAMVNQSSMTGEPLAIEKGKDDVVYAGTVVEEGDIKVEVKALCSESRISKIIELIDNSEELKANIQGKAEKLADNIVPFSLFGAAATYLITRNITKALAILLVDYSCAIKLSTPISVISAMREASTHKVMVKGGKYLEALAEADTIVFDKTGTLTVASPTVAKVVAFDGFERNYVLKTSACLEEHFPHSVARAIVKKAAEEELHHKEEHAKVEYVVAHGIASSINEEKAIIGSYHFVFEDEGISLSDKQKELIEKESNGYSLIYLAVGNKPAGFICISDPVREEAKQIISNLKYTGINQVIMLTGDGEKNARIVSEKLGIDKFYAQVLPEEKANIIEELKEAGHKVIMVGDGINDSPALAAADISISMKDGSDIAKEVADATLMSSNLESLVTVRKISQNLMVKINKNYRNILWFNTSLLVLGLFGYIRPTTSAVLHNLSTMGISADSMRPCL
ncbi:heavy metal translocating P-type ATPase [Clostridium sp. CTA-5]